jgi:hypothetical protein
MFISKDLNIQVEIIINMITGYKRRHKYFHDGDKTEYYLDNKEPLEKERPCIRCGRMPTPEGHDACLGRLTGVKWACCGHGKKEGYITFINGVTIRGNFKVKRN